MQNILALPTIKTGLAAAAITVASMVIMTGSASATTMQPSVQHSNSHAAHQMHQGNDHADKKMHHQGKAKHANHMNGHENTKHDQQSQAAIDLRVGLNLLLSEHVTTNLNVNRSIVSGASQAEIDAGMQSQLANADAIAAAVGSVYGMEAQTQFSEMFREHIEESNALAAAIEAGDESAKAEAAAELDEYLTELATFFSTAIPVLSYDAVYELLRVHEHLINSSTAAHDAGDFVQSYQLEREALKQVATIADALAGGIVATQPDKF